MQFRRQYGARTWRAEGRGRDCFRNAKIASSFWFRMLKLLRILSENSNYRKLIIMLITQAPPIWSRVRRPELPSRSRSEAFLGAAHLTKKAPPMRVGAGSGCQSAPAIASACLSAISASANGLLTLAEASTSRIASRGDG